MLLVRLRNEEGIDASHLFNIVNHDLERDQSFVIVKARSIELLEKLSDFGSMQNNTQAQETLVNGITDFYTRLECGDSSCVLLQLKCIEYLRNFYNNTSFKVNQYAHLLAKVIPISNQMIMKFVNSPNEQCFLVVNEVLELYRFIVEKYAAFNTISQQSGQVTSSVTIICELTLILGKIWDQYAAAIVEDASHADSLTEGGVGQRERTLTISSIMRIMS